MWRFWRRQHEAADPVADVRRAITAIAAARDTATAGAAAAIVTQAQVVRAVEAQRVELSRAGEQVTRAITAAERVATAAAAEDGALAAAPYLAHVDGLKSQVDVIAAVARQLDPLTDAADTNVRRARSMLAASRSSLDDALHEQLRVLVALEHLETARKIGELRSRSVVPGRPDRPEIGGRTPRRGPGSE